MNSILSICDEYSDNVWYSNCGVNNEPHKIAIEIEKKYKKSFLNTIHNYKFELDSIRRTDTDKIVLTLIKVTKSELITDFN